MHQLNQQITATMAKLKISKSELSRRLGKSRGYLTEMQKIGCSTEKQAELIAKIQMVADADKSIIAELEKKLDSANEAISKHGFNTTGIQRENLKLYNENKLLSKSAQERAEHVLALQTNLSNHEYEIAELRETVRKQDSKIAFLNVTLASANQNTEYQLSRLPKTAMAAFKLFIKMLFGGKA